MELCVLSLRNFLSGENWPDFLQNGGGMFTRDHSWPTMRVALAIVDDVTNGVLFIHGLNMVHRDIKPQNGKPIITYLVTYIFQFSIQNNVQSGKLPTLG